MKKQVFNPYLPINEYIPDGEPHVFGDRVYLYGSHDKEAGESFCMLPYVVWSAPVDDLSDWSNKVISYDARQDPLADDRRHHMYAPDCVKGNDGRYYLYYCLGGDGGAGSYDGPISVAVCDTPDGKFEYYGTVKNADGTTFDDVLVFDPAVINDDGIIRIYFGTCYYFDNLPKIKLLRDIVQARLLKWPYSVVKKGVLGAFTMTLSDDMLTVTSKPTLIMPREVKGTMWEKHPFFEGSSIRKIGDTYYFVYSSMANHELCYATSKCPDKDFTFRGTIVSNGDVGLNGRKPSDRLNHTGTNHGGIEKINGRWYVFYHRQTHGTDYSRQACCEEIKINSDGSINQVEITSCGLNDGPLKEKAIYPAVICCNLTNGHMPHGGNKSFNGLPVIKSGDGERFIADMTKGTRAVYKYFDFGGMSKIEITARGAGKIDVFIGENKISALNINSPSWTVYPCDINNSQSPVPLKFEVISGKIDILSFELK